MTEKQYTPYLITERNDGLLDILFPRDCGPGECPCHNRITVKPFPEIESEIRRNYLTWNERAKAATEDRQNATKALDRALASGRAYQDDDD